MKIQIKRKNSIDTLDIYTNNHKFPVIFGHELTDKERMQFDYMSDDELDIHEFFRYKGNVYDLCEFLRIDANSPLNVNGFNGYLSEGFFSGVVVESPYFDKCTEMYDSDFIRVGFYVC